jgi:hypothetical protein
VLTASSLFLFLLDIDREIAEEARSERCPSCGGVLHAANYRRKPRGAPDDVPAEFALRFSNCCSREGCRRRSRVPSVRFLDRRVYLGVVVTLVTAMRQGPTPTGAKKLQQLFGCTRRTLERWRTWWRERFPLSKFWKTFRARFAPAVDESQLPASMVVRFDSESSEGIAQLMRFLAAIGDLDR